MEWLKRIFISICILGLVGLGGYVVYNVAYGSGEVAGYNEGYSAGQKVGYSSGRQDGYNSGEQEGYITGYSLGIEEGYDEGHVSGKADGYEEGYEEGYASGEAGGYEEGMEAGLGHGYTLKDPTYTEAVAFLAEDRTDENEYIEDSYVCSHYTMDVCNNAEEEGLRCAVVELRFSDRGHVIIAFDTLDKGLLFFEPQFDNEVRVAVGESYSRLNDFQRTAYDDTIRDILIIW